MPFYMDGFSYVLMLKDFSKWLVKIQQNMPHPDFWTWKLKITHEKVAKDILQQKTLNDFGCFFF